MSRLRLNRIEDRQGNLFWDSEEGLSVEVTTATVTTSTGTQTVGEAISMRLPQYPSISSLLEDAPTDVLTEGSQVSVYGSTFRWTGGMWEPVDYVHVKAFFITSDDQAIRDALATEWPLDWGGFGTEYVVTEMIDATLTRRMRWVSSGARITLDSSSPERAVMRLSLPAGWNVLTGILRIDGADNAYSGFTASNTNTPLTFPDDYTSLIVTDLQVKNIYRSGKTFANGDGILVGGVMNELHLIRPVVRNVKLAEGAGISGSQGATGITIFRDNAAQKGVIKAVVEDMTVDRVFSEDPEFRVDQDGFRAFQYYQDANADRQTSLTVRGGVIRNSRNRSVKLQTLYANISGLKIERDSSVDIAGDGTIQAPDIDCQVGNFLISGIEYSYDGMSAKELIRVSGNDASPTPSAGSSISDIRCDSVNAAPIESIFANFSGGTPQQTVLVSNVSVRGPALKAFRVVNGTSLTDSRIVVNGMTCELLDEFAMLSAGGPKDWVLNGVFNTAATKVPLITKTGGGSNNSRFSCLACFGFEDFRTITEDWQPVTTRVDSITSLNGTSGMGVKYVDATLEPDEIFEFPRWAKTGNNGGINITFDSGLGGYGIYSYNSSSIIPLHVAGAADSITTRGGNEPTSGDFRLWTTVDGLRVSNRSDRTRSFFAELRG